MQITFELPGIDEIDAANLVTLILTRFPNAYSAPLRSIAHADRPDVGANQQTFNKAIEQAAAGKTVEVSVTGPGGGGGVDPQAGAAAAFGKQPAPSDAIAGQSLSVPVVQPAGVPTPPIASSPPAATVPVPGAAPSEPAALTTPAPGVEVDARGLPWDPRIHSSGRAKVAAGTWKGKRNVDPAVIAAVETELRAAMAAPARVFAAPTLPPAGIPLPPGAAPIPLPPGAPAVATVPGVSDVAGAAPLTFPQLMQKITGALSSGRLTQDQVTGAVKTTGLPSLPIAASRPDLVPAIGVEIDRLLASGLQ